MSKGSASDELGETLRHRTKEINMSQSCFTHVGNISDNGEFDPGSGRTLAVCLIHASRTIRFLREYISGGRVSTT